MRSVGNVREQNDDGDSGVNIKMLKLNIKTRTKSVCLLPFGFIYE